jgi:hypothetical protein
MGYSSEIFAGEWTYRSYLNNPDPTVDPNTLLFGFGILKIEEPSFGTLAGTNRRYWLVVVSAGNDLLWKSDDHPISGNGKCRW